MNVSKEVLEDIKTLIGNSTPDEDARDCGEVYANNLNKLCTKYGLDPVMIIHTKTNGGYDCSMINYDFFE